MRVAAVLATLAAAFTAASAFPPIPHSHHVGHAVEQAIYERWLDDQVAEMFVKRTNPPKGAKSLKDTIAHNLGKILGENVIEVNGHDCQVLNPGHAKQNPVTREYKIPCRNGHYVMLSMDGTMRWESGNPNPLPGHW